MAVHRVNAVGWILTRYKIKSPEPIAVTLGTHDYVTEMVHGSRFDDNLSKIMKYCVLWLFAFPSHSPVTC